MISLWFQATLTLLLHLPHRSLNQEAAVCTTNSFHCNKRKFSVESFSQVFSGFASLQVLNEHLFKCFPLFMKVIQCQTVYNNNNTEALHWETVRLNVRMLELRHAPSPAPLSQITHRQYLVVTNVPKSV